MLTNRGNSLATLKTTVSENKQNEKISEVLNFDKKIVDEVLGGAHEVKKIEDD